MSSDSTPRSPGMQSAPGANAAGSPKSGFLASAKASAAPTAQTILTLLKDASSMIQNAPYVGLIASIMLEILKIKDEVTACRDKWAEVMGDIQGIQKIIAEHADSADPTDTVLSDDIKSHLRDLEKVLESVTKALSRCSGKGKSELLRIALRRRELRSMVDKCKEQVRAELVFFNTRVGLANNRLLRSIHGRISNVNVSSQSIRIRYSLPAKPRIMHGRDDIIAELVASILHGPPARIALLGPGGIGKTSIALSVLHHDDIQESYKNACYFLACDAIENRDALIVSIGQMLGVYANAEQGLDEARVLDAVKNLGRAILCLDNFETPWESESNEVEEFLLKLADITSVHLLITMRGEEHPWNVSWTAQIPPIKPLSLDAAIRVFYDISHYNDADVENLIKAVDCIPLAVTLLAHYTRTSTPTKVWKQWSSSEHFKLLTRKQASHNKLSSVEYSIELSLQSPRLNDPQCLPILSVLSMLPDGIYESQEEDIQKVLEFEDPITDSLQRLKNCALISEDTDHMRSKLLSPILLYMRKHHPFQVISPDGHINLQTYLYSWIKACNKTFQVLRPEDTHLNMMLEQYTHDNNDNAQLMRVIHHNNFITSSMFEREDINSDVFQSYLNTYIETCNTKNEETRDIRSDGNNLRTLLQHYLLNRDNKLLTLDLICTFVNKSKFLGINEIALLSKCESYMKELGIAAEICYLQLYAEIKLRFDSIHDIPPELYRASSLANSLNNDELIGDICYTIGMYYEKLNQLDEAKDEFEEALDLHTDTTNILGVANALQSLGNVNKKLNNLDTAKQELEKALDLHQQVNDVLGQAHDLTYLGEVNILIHKLDIAKRYLDVALGLYNYNQDILGQANTLTLMGKLKIEMNELESAKEHLERALHLHHQVQEFNGQANDLILLGKLTMKLDKLNAAKEYLIKALQLHKQISHPTNESMKLLEEVEAKLAKKLIVD